MKTYLNTMDRDELQSLIEENNGLFAALKQEADDYDTEWKLQDLCRNWPRGLDSDAWDNCFLRYSGNWNMQLDVLRFFEQTQADYEFSELSRTEFEATADRINRYLAVLEEEPYLNIKDKDYDFMEKYVEEHLNAFCKEFSTYYQDVRDQFCDIDWLVTAITDECFEDILSAYYVDDNGNIYEEVPDRKIA